MLRIPFQTQKSSVSDDRSTETNESIAMTNNNDVLNTCYNNNNNNNNKNYNNNNSNSNSNSNSNNHYQRLHSIDIRILFWKKKKNSIRNNKSYCNNNNNKNNNGTIRRTHSESNFGIDCNNNENDNVELRIRALLNDSRHDTDTDIDDDTSNDCRTNIARPTTTVVLHSSTSLCVGNFIPLNDSTQYQLDAISNAQQIRRQCSTNIDTTVVVSKQQQQIEKNCIRKSCSVPITINNRTINNNNNSNSNSNNKEPKTTKYLQPSKKTTGRRLLQRAVTTMFSTLTTKDNETDCRTTSFNNSNDIMSNDDHYSQEDESFIIYKNNNLNTTTKDTTYIENQYTQQEEQVPLQQQQQQKELLVQQKTTTSTTKIDTDTDTNNDCTAETTTTLPIIIPMAEQPDIYGQIHPIENDTIIQLSLIEFEKQWKLLQPIARIQHALDAEHYCSQLVSIKCQQGKLFKLQFIRCDSYRINDAIERYVSYWTTRVTLFGIERAYKPITMSLLTDDERSILSCNYVSILCPPSSSSTTNTNTNTNTTQQPLQYIENRPILYADSGNFIPDIMTKDNGKNYVRACWYLLHYLGTHSIETQKRGVVAVLNAQRYGKNYPPPTMSFFRTIGTYFKRCVPVRISGYHILHPPPIVKVVYPIVRTLLLKQRLKLRLMVHTNLTNDTEVIHMFQSQYGIQPQQLPTSIIGGLNIINEEQWIQDQIQNGN